MAIDDKGSVFNQDVLGGHRAAVHARQRGGDRDLARSSGRRAAARSTAPTIPERNDDEWLKHINVSANGAEPELSYSPVTMTQWEPQERTY